MHSALSVMDRTLDLATNQYPAPALVYLARLSEGSRRTMREALDAIANMIGGGVDNAPTFVWSRLRYEHTGAIRARLAEIHAPATANKMLSALRGVLRECWRLGLMSAEDYHRAVDISAVKGTTLPRGRALAGGEIRALLATCATDASAAGIRDAAMLAVLYASGLRRTELVSLDLADYDSESGALTVRHGKGHRARISYVADGAAHMLGDWLEVRGSDSGPLFVAINKGGVLRMGPLSTQTVLGVTSKRGKDAGLAHFSPHDLRRSFVSDLLDAGADISAVQQLAGHANVQTTARYDRRGEASKRKAASLLHVPYIRRVR
jgi:site-specific recombinase XerD